MVGDVIQSNWRILAIYHYYKGHILTSNTYELYLKKELKRNRRKDKIKKIFRRKERVVIINNYYRGRF